MAGIQRPALLALLGLLGLRCAAPPPQDPPRPAGVGADPGPGPAVGTQLPAFELPDQDGRPRSLESLRGPKGLLLNFNRSVVW